jgi:hypothetical protein
MAIVGCSPSGSCDVSTSLYAYRPSLGANAALLAVWTLCLVGCVAATARCRRMATFGILMALACILHVLGYLDRVEGWRNPWDLYPYAQGTVLLTVAPAFVTSRWVAYPRAVMVIH